MRTELKEVHLICNDDDLWALHFALCAKYSGKNPTSRADRAGRELMKRVSELLGAPTLGWVGEEERE